MIVVDSSVIVAVYKGEPDADELIQRLVPHASRVISAANWLEATMVCLGDEEEPDRLEVLDAIAEALGIEIVPFTAQQSLIAREAFRRLGKGRRNHAKLNFGDCMAYALAKCLNASLLFKGNDFVHTDVKIV